MLSWHNRLAGRIRLTIYLLFLSSIITYPATAWWSLLSINNNEGLSNYSIKLAFFVGLFMVSYERRHSKGTPNFPPVRFRPVARYYFLFSTFPHHKILTDQHVTALPPLKVKSHTFHYTTLSCISPKLNNFYLIYITISWTFLLWYFITFAFSLSLFSKHLPPTAQDSGKSNLPISRIA